MDIRYNEMKVTLKDRIAIEKGYPSWDDMFDWICRPSERPEVVGQLIEAATKEYCRRLIEQVEDDMNSDYMPTSDRQEMAYHDGITALRDKVIEIL